MHDADKTDIERRVQAELHVEAFLDLLQKRYGLKPEDVPIILDDMRWLRQHRVGANRITWSVALGLVALAVTGVAKAFWEGFKHSIGHG